MSSLPEPLVLSAIDDLVTGRGVRRGRHQIPPELAEAFRERLVANGFAPLTVAEIPIEIGVRVPAWLFRPPVADFGTVFWEVFTPRAKRKLFGSDVRNAKGDWEIQLYPSSPEALYASLERAESYDASRPIGLY